MKNFNLSSLYKSLALASAVAGIFFSPAKTGSANAFGVSDACADGTCCPQPSARCGLNGQNYSDEYWTQSGPCPC